MLTTNNSLNVSLEPRYLSTPFLRQRQYRLQLVLKVWIFFSVTVKLFGWFLNKLLESKKKLCPLVWSKCIIGLTEISLCWSPLTTIRSLTFTINCLPATAMTEKLYPIIFLLVLSKTKFWYFSNVSFVRITVIGNLQTQKNSTTRIVCCFVQLNIFFDFKQQFIDKTICA